MSIKICKAKNTPSVESKIIQQSRRLLPQKLAGTDFSIKQYSLNLMEKLWYLSTHSIPIIRHGLKVKTLKFRNYNCEWIYKNEEDKKLTVFYIHGGAYLVGSLSMARHRSIRYPLNTGCSLFLVDYRISAVGKYPYALDDTFASYKYMLENLPDDSEIVVLGDSAGGGLALSLTKKLIENKLKLPKKLILISPWTDLTCSSNSYNDNAQIDCILSERFLKVCARCYTGSMEMLYDPYVSPIFLDYSNFPPIHFHVGTNEILLNDSKTTAFKASSQGVEVKLKIWNGMFHMFHYFEHIIPESSAICKEIYKDIIK